MLGCGASVHRSLRWGALGLAGLVLATTITADADARTRHRRGHRPSPQQTYSPPVSTIVVDANTGAVLQATNPDATRHPASLTKMMTLYMLFERLQAGKLSLTSELPVSAHAAAQAPSKLGLKPGDSIRVENAIKAVVTKSANDVAVVIGEALGGDESSFARMMTAKARARDAKVETLIAQNFDKASNRRAPADIPVAKVEPKAEPVLAAIPMPTPAPVRTAEAAPAGNEQAVTVDPPSVGSTAPIKPNAVKTFVVHPGNVRTASLTPPAPDTSRLAPAPATTQPTRITQVATVKSDVPPLPPTGSRPGILGTLPAKVASAGGTVPVPDTLSSDPADSAAKHSGWMIQVGAFDDEKDAKHRLDAAQGMAKHLLGSADPFTEKVNKGRKSLYRARFAGLGKDQAEAACKHLKHSDIPCMMLKN